MRESFSVVSEGLFASLRAGEQALAWLDAENTAFVRFNHGRVRQPGTVSQGVLALELIDGERHATGSVTFSGDAAQDRERAQRMLQDLRATLPHLAADPHLHYNRQPSSTETLSAVVLPEAGDMTEQILAACRGLDFVGILAAGEVMRGFASSLGQRNWFARPSFHLGFSLYSRGDKAVQSSCAGLAWDRAELERRIGAAAAQLEIMSRPAKTVEPGRYRVYLAPGALREVLSLLAWDAFGLKSHRTRRTPLLRMLGGEPLDASVTLREVTAEGAGPAFGRAGFLKPPALDLVREGALCGALVSPRSAREYDVATNGAGEDESPEALELSAGGLPGAEVPGLLERGIWVNNLWYLNYSDRNSCRITGMTRFATFWVEGGRVQAPLNVMRFDETLHNMLGARLIGLTREREMFLDEGTYERRSTGSMRLPGALIDDLSFTL